MITLHATPPLGYLPASDVQSLYLAALLQLVYPGRWTIGQDWNPHITHLDHVVPIRHLPSLPGWSMDEDKVEATIWRTYIEQSLTDLVVSPPKALLIESHPVRPSAELPYSQLRPSGYPRPN